MLIKYFQKTSVLNTEMTSSPVTAERYSKNMHYIIFTDSYYKIRWFSSRVTEDMKVQHIALLCDFAKV